jgi:Tetracyclin repressor-like, C-terminal domain
METALARQLSGDGEERKPTALDAFKAARRRFIAGERIEMGALAAQIGTSRVTLHRWVGNRDQLLGEILWSLGEPTLRDARKATRSRGGAGIGETLDRFVRVVLAAPFMRAFLEREPEIALRVLTTKSSPFAARLASAIEDMLAEEVEAGRIDPPMDLNDLAFVTLRLAESFFYTDVIVGGEPDPDKARIAIAALLR